MLTSHVCFLWYMRGFPYLFTWLHEGMFFHSSNKKHIRSLKHSNTKDNYFWNLLEILQASCLTIVRCMMMCLIFWYTCAWGVCERIYVHWYMLERHVWCVCCLFVWQSFDNLQPNMWMSKSFPLAFCYVASLANSNFFVHSHLSSKIGHQQSI